MGCNTQVKRRKTMENNLSPNFTNTAFIEGQIASEISHFNNKKEIFYEFLLDVPRLSGTVDTVPVTISKGLVESYKIALKQGETLNLKGEFRSRNKQENGASHLLLFFFAKDVLTPTLSSCNNVQLQGYICKDPVFRETPFKRQICDILLAVNRAVSHKSDYIPCIVWGRHANLAKNLPIGTKISVTGRIQSRKYSKQLEDGTIQNKIAYEVSINSMEIDSMPYSNDSAQEKNA